MSHMERVKNHFQEEAEQYDEIIRNLIPYYSQMVEALVNALPFEKSEKIEIVDLGCGTGTLARAIKDTFSNVRITCLDVSDNMLNMAKNKLSDLLKTAYLNEDFYDFSFSEKYDAIVSSLALHHLQTKEDKLDFYKKIHSALHIGGVFVNADVVLGSNDSLQKTYMKQWKNFMYRNVSKDEVENKWIPNYYKEDRPISMLEHLEMLKEVGFYNVDIIWKYYNFAVYIAIK